MDSTRTAWKFVSGCVFAAMLAGGAVRAEDSGFYVGAGLGEARINSDDSDDFNDGDLSYRAIAGYSFNKYFSVEGGYLDGGTLEDTELGPDGFDVAQEIDAFFVAALAKWPIGENFAPFAKLGYTAYDASVTFSDPTSGLSESFSGNGEELMLGIGCEYKVGEKFSLRAEWEKIRVPNVDFRILSVGATFRF
jgi:OmpA-OmpF porin, OOP family